MKKMMRRPAVEAATGLSRSTIYRLIDAGVFPKQIKVSERAVAWSEDDIAAYLAARQEAAA